MLSLSIIFQGSNLYNFLELRIIEKYSDTFYFYFLSQESLLSDISVSVARENYLDIRLRA